MASYSIRVKVTGTIDYIIEDAGTLDEALLIAEESTYFGDIKTWTKRAELIEETK